MEGVSQMTLSLKKSISLILTFLLLISLMGCSSSSSSKSETSDQKAKVTKAKNDKKQKDPTGETSKQIQASGITNQPNTANANTQAEAAKPETNQQTTVAKPSSPAQVVQPSKPKTTANTAASQQTTSPAPVAPAAAAPAAPVQTVKISITGPKDRPTILNLTTVNIKDNETILDVLLDAAGKNNIDVDKTGSGATAYVRGIDGIYERDYGAMSGWICKQNGTGIAKSAGAITVKAGDQIEWIYKEN
jgi:cytoskeletal protein RodZ